MIDLRKVEPLKPKHAYFNPENGRPDFLCIEMKNASDKAHCGIYVYRCADASCGLVYNKLCFIGYYKNPKLPYPQVTYPENILDKAMVCRPRCAILKLSTPAGFYVCADCGGNFMKHPEFGMLATPEDWFIQDSRVLKYFIRQVQKSADALRREAMKHPDSEDWKLTLKQLEEAEKMFAVEILYKCRL